jgi:hypothetical protein
MAIEKSARVTDQQLIFRPIPRKAGNLRGAGLLHIDPNQVPGNPALGYQPVKSRLKPS